MKICQKTKHEISISACAAVEREPVLCRVGRQGSATGSSLAKEQAETQTSGIQSHWAVKLLKLLIDFAKTAIYISKCFFNNLLFKLNCRWKVLAPFFPKLDFLAAYENPYIVSYTNRSLKCSDEAMACNLLCCSSGTVLTHLHKKGDMQSSVMPHQNQLDLYPGIRRRQEHSHGHSPPDTLVQSMPSTTVVELLAQEQFRSCVWSREVRSACGPLGNRLNVK